MAVYVAQLSALTEREALGMAAEQAEGVLAPEEGELKQPSKIAAELDATDKNLTDAPATLREDQVQNAVAFLAHPKVR